jgi:hypothetical protein
VGGVPTFLPPLAGGALGVRGALAGARAERWALSIETLGAAALISRSSTPRSSTPRSTWAVNDGRQALAGHRSNRIEHRAGPRRDEARRGDVVTLVIGDHGMADVRTFVDPRPFVAKGSARAFVDSTMMRFWGGDASLDQARLSLERARIPGTWLDAAALKAREAPTEGDPYGRAMFLLDEGVIFAPSFVGGRVRGMHGYDVSSGSARAALASDAEIPRAARTSRISRA